MTTEEKITALERLLRKCPDVLTPYGAAKWMHMSKNTVYALIREGKQSIAASCARRTGQNTKNTSASTRSGGCTIRTL